MTVGSAARAARKSVIALLAIVWKHRRMILAIVGLAIAWLLRRSVRTGLSKVSIAILTLNQMNERQSYRSGGSFVEYLPTQSTDLLPFYRSRNAYDYVVDVSVGPTIDKFTLVFQMYAENLTSKAMVVTFRVVRN